MPEEIEKVTAKMQNIYAYLEKLSSYYSYYNQEDDETKCVREVKIQLECIINALNLQTGSIETSSKINASNKSFNQEVLIWDTINKFVAVQENYSYAIESVEKGICSEKNALDFISSYCIPLLCDGAKACIAIQDEEIGNLIITMGQSAGAAFSNINLNNEKRGPDSPLESLNTDKQLELQISNVVDERNGKYQIVNNGIEQPKEYGDEIETIDKTISQMKEILSETPIDVEMLYFCKRTLSEIEVNINRVNAQRRNANDNNEIAVNMLMQQDSYKEEVYKIGIQDAMLRLASLSERAAGCKTINKEEFINFGKNSLAVCGFLYNEHDNDEQVLTVIDRSCERINISFSSMEHNSDGENE